MEESRIICYRFSTNIAADTQMYYSQIYGNVHVSSVRILMTLRRMHNLKITDDVMNAFDQGNLYVMGYYVNSE